MSLAPATIPELQDAVRSHAHVLPHGGRTKPALSRTDATPIDMTRLSGVVEYDPMEFTITALAGTRLADVQKLLGDHGQHLPFDPPFAAAGATLGGTVAAGLSGPSRLRCGGVRDFIIGVRFVDGTGELIRGGGKVVKNAAGFDLPKLMVGSCGRLGVLAEITFKVFPRPRSWITVRVACRDLPAAIETMCRWTGGPMELDAIDLEPPGTLMVRMGGDEAALRQRATAIGGEIVADEYWRGVNEFAWAGETLVKVAVTPRRIVELDKRLSRKRRYSVAGNVAWITQTDVDLGSLGLSGLVVRGERPIRLGADASGTFVPRVKRALDPDGRFPPF